MRKRPEASHSPPIKAETGGESKWLKFILPFILRQRADSRAQTTGLNSFQPPEKDFDPVGLGQCFKCPGTHTFSYGTLQTVLQTQERLLESKCGSPVCIFTLGSGLPLVTEATAGSFTGGTNSGIISPVSSFKLT